VQSDATTGLDVEDAADASLSIETGAHAAPVFDPVAAEHDAVSASDDVVFRFDADALDNADDVLSLHAMETLSLDDAAGLHPSLESVDAAALRWWKRTRLPQSRTSPLWMCRWKRPRRLPMCRQRRCR
jgi:chemosensory pili system protein ChpA (sensor histidine kinase/response regulator)